MTHTPPVSGDGAGLSDEGTAVADRGSVLPDELQVEVTAACNLRCRMCLVRYRPPVDRLSGSMPLERFTALVDDLPGLRKVTLQGLGEPLLVPHLAEMVAYAARRGARVGFNTNATILTRQKAEQLVRAGLDWLHVSLDGARAETYEAVRDGARFDRVLRNLEGVVEVRAALGSARPSVWLVFVAMRRNVAELGDLVRLAARLGVDGVRAQNLSHSFSDTDPAGAYQGIRAFTEAEALWRGRGEEGARRAAGDDARAAFAEARRVAAELGVALRLPDDEAEPPPRGPGEPGCDWPWRAPYVTHDGQVQPCCMVMGTDRARLGDLATEAMPVIWRGRGYRGFREALRSDAPPAVCRGCSMYRGVF